MFIIFLTQHSVILILESANTVDTGISCAYLRLFYVILKRSGLKKTLVYTLFHTNSDLIQS